MAVQAGTLFDGTFKPSDWTITDTSSSSPGLDYTAAITQSLTDGNPAEAQVFNWSIAFSAQNQQVSYLVHSINNTFTYDPSVSGAIAGLTISFDLKSRGLGFSIAQPFFRAELCTSAHNRLHKGRRLG